MLIFQNQETPLIQACYKQHAEAVRALLERSNCDLNAKEKACGSRFQFMLCLLTISSIFEHRMDGLRYIGQPIREMVILFGCCCSRERIGQSRKM